MNYPRLELILCDFRGTWLYPLTALENATATWIDGKGALEVLLPDYIYPWNDLRVGRWIGVWLHQPGERPYHVQHYMIRRRQRGKDSQGRRFVKLRGMAPIGLLSWKAIQSLNLYESRYSSDGYLKVNARSDSTGAFTKNDFADDMMRDFVRQQAGSYARTERSLATVLPFTVEGDRSLVPRQQVSAPWANLLETLDKIAKASREDRYRPVWVSHEVVVTGFDRQFALQYRVFVGSRGRMLGSQAPIRLALDETLFTELSLVEDHENEATVVYTFGIVRDQISNINFRAPALEEGLYEWQAAKRRGTFPANWIEKRYTLNEEVIREGMRQAGSRYLRENAPTRRVFGELALDGRLRMLRDIQPGDVVVGTFGDVEQDWRVSGVEYSMAANDGLRIKPRLEAVEPTWPTLRLPNNY